MNIDDKMLLNSEIPKKFTISLFGKFTLHTQYSDVPKENVSNNDFDKLEHDLKNQLRGYGDIILKSKRERDKECINKPMEGQIVGKLSKHGDGTGFAACFLDNGYIVPMCLNVLTDCVINGGIDEHGCIKSKLIVAKIKGKCKLIRYDSELHKAIKNYESHKKNNKIGLKELERGKIYIDCKGYCAVFLGYVTTLVYSPSETEPYYKKTSKNKTLWLNLGPAKKKDCLEVIKSIYSSRKGLLYFYELHDKHTYNFGCYEKKINDIDPFVVYRVADSFYEDYKKSLKLELKRQNQRSNYVIYRQFRYDTDTVQDFSSLKEILEFEITSKNKSNISRNFFYKSKYFNMVLFGTDPTSRERVDLLKITV